MVKEGWEKGHPQVTLVFHRGFCATFELLGQKVAKIDLLLASGDAKSMGTEDKGVLAARQNKILKEI